MQCLISPRNLCNPTQISGGGIYWGEQDMNAELTELEFASLREVEGDGDGEEEWDEDDDDD